MKHAQFISQRTNLWKSNYKRLPHSKSLSQVTDFLHPNPAKLQESFNFCINSNNKFTELSLYKL